jgi:hypothetical protein
LLDDPRRYQSIQIAHDAAVRQRRRQYQPLETLPKHLRVGADMDTNRSMKSSHTIVGAAL